MKSRVFIFVILVTLSLDALSFAYQLEISGMNNERMTGCDVSVTGAKSYPNISFSGKTQNGMYRFDGWFRGNGKCTCINISVNCPGYKTGYLYNDWSCASGGGMSLSTETNYSRNMNDCHNEDP